MTTALASLAPLVKTALVTGSARGIGAAAAIRLAKDGFAVGISDLEFQKDLAKGVIEKIEKAGGQAVWVPADVTQRDQVFAAAAATAKAFGGLGVVVNNAGIAPIKPLLEVRLEDLDKLYRTNVHSIVWGIQAAAHTFSEQKSRGKIVSAASIAALNGFPLLGIYSSTKFAVRSLTQTAAMELAKSGINVNAYAPGPVDTPMWDLIDEEATKVEGGKPGEFTTQYASQVALGRMEVADDVAKLISFLAGPDSDFITGQTIVVDGGMVYH